MRRERRHTASFVRLPQSPDARGPQAGALDQAPMRRQLFGYRPAAVLRVFAAADERAAGRRLRRDLRLQALRGRLAQARRDAEDCAARIALQGEALRSAEAALAERVVPGRREPDEAHARFDAAEAALAAQLEQARRRLADRRALLKGARDGITEHVARIAEALAGGASVARAAVGPSDGGAMVGSPAASVEAEPRTVLTPAAVGLVAASGGAAGSPARRRATAPAVPQPLGTRDT